MVKLADTRDLKSLAYGVPVRPRLEAPYQRALKFDFKITTLGLNIETMKILPKLDRTSTLDMQECIKNSGGNRYSLIVMAAARAREIRKENASSDKFEHLHPAVTALREFQDGKLDSTYMKKIK